MTRNKTRSTVAQRLSSVSPHGQPQFEKLENRLALSCSAAVIDGVLLVAGDKLDNEIDVFIDGSEGTLTAEVQCHDGELFEFFSDFNAVEVEGGGGDDTINVVVMDVAVGADDFFELAVEGGKGHDEVTVSAVNLSAADGGVISTEVEGGKGEDTVIATMQNIEVGSEGVVNVEVEGGQHDDDLTLEFVAPEDGLSASVAEGGTLNTSVEGGKGNDTMTIGVDGLTVANNGFLNAEIEGGPGHDTADISLSKLTIAGNVDVNIEGGPGDDTGSVVIDTEFGPTTVAETAVVDIVIEGGPGFDTGTAEILGDGFFVEDGAIINIYIDEGPQ